MNRCHAFCFCEKTEQEGWITAHASTVQVVTPYDNVVTIMHEGGSGGGKSEMLEPVHREPSRVPTASWSSPTPKTPGSYGSTIECCLNGGSVDDYVGLANSLN